MKFAQTPIALLAFFFFACSSETDASIATHAAPFSDAATSDATHDAATILDAADAAVCNDLLNTAPPVPLKQVALDPPAASGGTITDGTYFLTDATIYTGTSGPYGVVGMGSTTIHISGGVTQLATSNEPTSRTALFVANGIHITSTDTCPDANTSEGSFTATPAELTVFLPAGSDEAGARTLAETFTKQ